MDQEQTNQDIHSNEKAFDIIDKKSRLFDVVISSTLLPAFRRGCSELLRDIIKLPDVVYGERGKYVSAQIDNLTGVFEGFEAMVNRLKKARALTGGEKDKKDFGAVIKEWTRAAPWGSPESFEQMLSLVLK